MRLPVRPLLDRPADDVAMIRPAGGADGFLEQDQPAHEGTGVAAGVAQQRPAGRLLRQAEALAVRMRLPGVVPAVLAVEAPGLQVHLVGQRRDLGCTLQHVQLRADQEHLRGRPVTAQPFGELRIAHPAGVAHAGQDAPCMLRAHGADQVLPQRTEGHRVQQHHAPVAQPDAAFVRLKPQQPAQIGVAWVLQVRRVGFQRRGLLLRSGSPRPSFVCTFVRGSDQSRYLIRDRPGRIVVWAPDPSMRTCPSG